jgi:hypothetical protein
MGGVSETRIPVGVRRVFRHVPVEVRRAIIPPYGAALTERLLDLIDRLMRGSFRRTVIRLLGLADRPSSRHQSINEVGSLGLAEIWVRHAPQSAADDEVPTIGRHCMFHGAKPISAAT